MDLEHFMCADANGLLCLLLLPPLPSCNLLLLHRLMVEQALVLTTMVKW
jgi:hypothetical protein